MTSRRVGQVNSWRLREHQPGEVQANFLEEGVEGWEDRKGEGDKAADKSPELGQGQSGWGGGETEQGGA